MSTEHNIGQTASFQNSVTNWLVLNKDTPQPHHSLLIQLPISAVCVLLLIRAIPF